MSNEIKVECNYEEGKIVVNMTVKLLSPIKFYTVRLKPPKGMPFSEFYDVVKEIVEQMNEEEISADENGYVGRPKSDLHFRSRLKEPELCEHTNVAANCSICNSEKSSCFDSSFKIPIGDIEPGEKISINFIIAPKSETICDTCGNTYSNHVDSYPAKRVALQVCSEFKEKEIQPEVVIPIGTICGECGYTYALHFEHLNPPHGPNYLPACNNFKERKIND